MRACGGVWVAQAQRRRRPRDGRRQRAPVACLPTTRATRSSASGSRKEEEAGYYYGFSNEGLWPLCHIVHTRPQFRPGGLGALPGGEREVRGRRAGGDRGRRVADGPHPGLPLRAPARADQARAPGCPHRDLLAHPVAELRGLLHLPVAGRAAPGHARRRPRSASTPSTTATTSWRRSSGPSRRASTGSSSRSRAASTRPPSSRSRSAWRPTSWTTRPTSPAGAARAPRHRRPSSSASAWSGSTTPRGCPSASGRWAASSSAIPSTASASSSCSSRRRAAARIARYQELEAEVDAVVREVNETFGTRRWRPILYLKRHHDHRDIWPFYRHADFCMVTSLHDGMNLVAKEFVSVRDDEDGALILSQFTGRLVGAAGRAPREPLRHGRHGRRHPRRGRDAAARSGAPGWRACAQAVREHNIYRWAGLLLSELQRIPEAAGLPTSTASPREGER